MADDSEKTPEENENSGADKTKKTVLLLIILSVLVMVLTPVITILSIRMMTKTADEAVEKPKPKGSFEIALPKIQVNVAETNGTRFVQLDIVVEVSDANMAPLFQEKSPENEGGKSKRIIAAIISIVSDKNLESLVTKQAKEKLSHEIKTALNDVMHEYSDGIITDVYFTDS